MTNHRLSTKFIAVSALTIAAAVLTSDQILYKFIIVPRLQDIQYVPKLWWAIVFSPILLCGILVGAKSDNIFELIAASISMSVICRVYIYLSAMVGQPGRLKSNAIESPFMFWTTGLLINFLIITIILITGWCITKLFKRVRGGLVKNS